jgi:predicted nucleotidyltransferase component of viral defense system
VIPKEEILALRAEWGLRDDVIEKDYVLGWVLAVIGSHPKLNESWLFKGGTALRKCYLETYRFSEDLDFTVLPGGPESPEELQPIFVEIAKTLADTGIELVVDETSFRRRKNKRGKPTTEGRIGYRGPRAAPGLPKVKLDITADERVVGAPESRAIMHAYSDRLSESATVRCYSFDELMAEKIRALAERCRPRDLYDVVQMHRREELASSAAHVAHALQEKCAFAGISVPTWESTARSPFRAELETEWESMLGHQLPNLPPIAEYWARLEEVFRWLDGERSQPLPRAELKRAPTSSWAPPATLHSWRQGFPLELVRFAGANLLKVRLDYQAERGRRGWRTVEPYSLRRTDEGGLLLFVVNDQDQLRSYRVDRIAGAEVTGETFVPQYRVEF